MTEKEGKKKVKKIGFMSILAWILGVMLIFGSFGSLITSNYLTAIFYFLGGLIILPYFNNFLEEKYNFKLSGFLRLVIAIVFMVLASNSMTDNLDLTNADNNLENNVKQISNENLNKEQIINSKEEVKKEILKDECSFTGYQCQEKNIVSCKLSGSQKVIKVEKTCLRECTTGHCVYNIGDTITRDNVGVTLEMAKEFYIPAEIVSGYVMSDSQELFKVRIKVTNNKDTEEYFADPSYNMVILDDLGNQYEPELFWGNDKDQKEFGSGNIYPKVTKTGDVYFERFDKNAKEIRIIIKDGFFSVYTNENDKGFFEDESFEWLVKLE